MENNLVLSTGAEPHLHHPRLANSEAANEPVSASPVRSLRKARRDAINRFEVEYIRDLLQRSEGNVTRAAAIADVSRQVIHKLIAKHRLSG